MIMPFEQSREPAASTGSSQAPSATRSQAQVVNDAKVMEFMKAKFVKMEQDLKDAQSELNRLKTRPALATQREDYVLGEMELVNRQLDCEFESCSVYKFACIVLLLGSTDMPVLQVSLTTSRRRKFASRSVWIV